ncbi:MAG: GNAT family N-acetyltransferase [Pseudomonadota bacterium]
MIIRPARLEDADAAIALLHGQMSQKISPERWRRIFDYDWGMEKPDCGYVAEVEGRIVGYLGAVHSERACPEATVKVTNMCAWYVEKAHRGSAGLLLMDKATADPERHYTSMTSTSNPRTMMALRACGFRSLDDTRWDWQRQAGHGTEISVISDPDALRPYLKPHEARFVRDLAPCGVRACVLRHPEAESFALFSLTQKGADQPWWDVLYIRDAAEGFLARHGQGVANALLSAENAVLSADARFCGGIPQDATRVTLPAPRFVKTRGYDGPPLDHLYTELQLLSLKLD